jgi:hypothetical protein
MMIMLGNYLKLLGLVGRCPDRNAVESALLFRDGDVLKENNHHVGKYIAPKF